MVPNVCSVGKGCVWTRGPVGYNTAMRRMRIGLVVGFAAGYYLGAKAGRERYEQMQSWLRDFRRSAPYEKAQAAVELGIERVKQQAEPLVGADTGSPNGPGR